MHIYILIRFFTNPSARSSKAVSRSACCVCVPSASVWFFFARSSLFVHVPWVATLHFDKVRHIEFYFEVTCCKKYRERIAAPGSTERVGRSAVGGRGKVQQQAPPHVDRRPLLATSSSVLKQRESRVRAPGRSEGEVEMKMKIKGGRKR